MAPHLGAIAARGRRTVPLSVRTTVSRALLRRPGQILLPLDRLLLGAQGGWTAREFVQRTGQLLWSSTRVLDGPHLALLRQAAQRDWALTDDDILASDYARLGRRCIAAGGNFFGARSDPEIVDVARGFLHAARGGTADARRTAQSRAEDPILVAPIRNSDYFQVLDGH